jgi:superfamily II DNA helicase RecQ
MIIAPLLTSLLIVTAVLQSTAQDNRQENYRAKCASHIAKCEAHTECTQCYAGATFPDNFEYGSIDCDNMLQEVQQVTYHIDGCLDGIRPCFSVALTSTVLLAIIL